MIQYKDDTLQVFQSALYQTTSAVVQTEEAIIMTDPNWLPSELEEIQQFVLSIKKNRPLYIIYTHSDFDHIIGSGAFPNATIIASERLKNRPDQEKVMKEIHDFDEGYYVERNYEPHYPCVDIVVKENGQTLDLGRTTLTFYLAPGHTDDGLFTVVEPFGIFLSGDYLSDVEFPFIYSSFKDYQHTVEKAEKIFHNHTIRLHVPGHGKTTNSQEEMTNRLSSSKMYLNNLVEEDEGLETILRKKYKFYNGMKEIHEENIRKAKQ